MPANFQRPENALKRANEFLEVGKKQPALDVLYDVITFKKHRTWQKIHEQIMRKYLELCVDLCKSHLAKEGLYQYKNICQQVSLSGEKTPKLN
ncbi:eukaryotic translation initiation factor 3 subunit A-like [Erpetoichthys calabaricus]|uniref:eukaryotic translation initiation factor 3 subunit A-like n=1 Tax=Erpetoichthys calabaricus TaxID=27687 RepID=UPI002234D87E|nr:eukaryotic translation initiation factor 3 subunit A-like [Erpetoichthys calabaricus]